MSWRSVDRTRGITGGGGLFSLNSLNRGLAAYWTLDEASGTRLDSINNYHLADNNGVGSIAGKNNNAATFSSTSTQYLSTDTTNLIWGPANGSFAWSIWIYRLSTSDAGVVLARDNTLPGREWEVAVLAGGSNAQVSVFRQGGGGINQSTGNNLLTATTWHHLIFQWALPEKTATLTINGADTVFGWGATVGGPAPGVSTTKLTMGQRQLSSLPFNGYMDECAFWTNRVLQKSEKEWLFNSGAGRFGPVYAAA